MNRNAILTALDLIGVQIWIAQIRPDAADIHRIGANAHLQAAVHIRRQLQPGLGRLPITQCDLGEAIGYGLQLYERRQHDVYVWFPGSGLVQTSYDIWGEHAHGNFLRHDGLAVAAELLFKRGIEAIVVVCGGGDSAMRI